MDFILSKVFEFNQVVVLVCLMLAVFRIYLEVMNFNFERLPLTRLMARGAGSQSARQFHRLGFYCSVGYLLLFGPTFFLT